MIGADAMVKCLEEEGYSVAVSENYIEVSGVLKSETVDLVILDVNLPGKDGFEIYRQMVSVRKIPAIFLTARDEEDDIVKGFDLGAEDYITKPFEIRELLARIQVVLRGEKIPSAEIFSFSELHLNTETKNVFFKENEIHLTRTEYAILKLLMQNPKRVITKSTLLERIAEDTPDCTESSIKIHISNLRKKLRAVSGKDYIEAVWGIGFKLKEE